MTNKPQTPDLTITHHAILLALITYRSETSSPNMFAKIIEFIIDINLTNIKDLFINDMIPTTGVVVLCICAFVNDFAVN